MKIKFLGAAGTVTGSCYQLTSKSGTSVLVDCGLYQGDEELEKLNYSPINCDCQKLSGAILTHAHLDHCGRLPILLKQGFHTDIWMTPPTKDIAELSLIDSAKINEEEKKNLYNRQQAHEIINLFKTIEYDTPFKIGDFEVIFRDAGHILGSASVEITDLDGKKIVFSGDLGNSPEDLIKPTEQIITSDIVVMESTYGNSLHPDGNPSLILKNEINAIEKSGGTLLIPAFSIERTQEILHRILHLKNSKEINDNTPIFLDSPMAEKITKIFEKYPQYFNTELKQDLYKGSPFIFSGLTIVEKQKDFELLSSINGPKVVIAGSGMMTGGRILGLAIRHLPIPSTRLLIVGYQAENTLGRKILEGNKNVLIGRYPIEVKATISESQVMSSHADQERLLSWLKEIKGVKKVYLTHGEDSSRVKLSSIIKASLEIKEVNLPKLNQEETDI